ERTGLGLLLPGDHAEERRLARAVGTDHADDAAARKREVQAVDQEAIAVSLAQPLRLDDEVAEPRAGRDRDLRHALARLLRLVLGEQLLVLGHARLALRLARARRHPHPLELALERASPCGRLLLLLAEALLLLLQPRRVVALPRDARPTVQLEDPAGDVV